MAKGRGDAMVVIMVICLLVMALQCKAYEVLRDHIVGGKSGWNMNYKDENWVGQPGDRTFGAGERYVFKYRKGEHNVVVVNKEGFDNCKTTPTDKVYTSGNDSITLQHGDNYFICSMKGHCPTMRTSRHVP
ncbi:putative Phytocyanin domain, cupredoxin [Helianthus annuus]|uniref:Phytocyanin domain, cupredoxin n=1 Tax=Helianthus annuus TaxID=4232 RepID=A0A251V1H1_HELAN|nr:basic blue protein [Helianthus annuus]KAF5811844.1 putative Phytocyanin domain, cupredoxin [Helianthus annuus]